MSEISPFAQALMNSDEAVRLSREWSAAYEERARLRQRVADLAQAQQDLAQAESALREKTIEAVSYLASLKSAI